MAYHGILKEVRADYHGRFADWLESETGERASEYEEILGYHLERAYRYLADSDRWTTAAGSWPAGPPLGSDRPAGEPSLAGTSHPR